MSDSERYKALARGPLLALRSADGFRWEKMQDAPVISDGAFDSLNIPVWDQERSQYLAIYRDFIDGVRTIKTATSTDFLNWTKGEWADFGEAPLEHLYTNGTAPYFRAPHIFISFPKRFHPWRNHYADAPRPGISDAVFMTSRDGFHWDRRFMEAFVRPGRDPRNWLNRNNLLAAGTLLTAPDEISLYMIRNYKFPSIYLERMTLRTDGFVSVHADYEGGELLTRLLTFEGSNLVLNFATSAAGSIRLELQDAHGQPFPWVCYGGVACHLWGRDRARGALAAKSRQVQLGQAPGPSGRQADPYPLSSEGCRPLLHPFSLTRGGSTMAGMIVAPQPLAVEQGARILMRGGNAVDAA